MERRFGKSFSFLMRYLLGLWPNHSKMPQGEQSRYEVSGIRLYLPREHVLPRYQAAHPLYDRFLGVLGDCLPEDSVVIDIGANIGDSIAALCGSATINALCVEGSPKFFEYLEKNAELITSRGHRIKCVNAIIGPKDGRAVIRETSSTGSIETSETGTPMQTLDDISNSRGTPSTGPILIKVDTDGFDAEVIASGERTLREHEPLLFWENEIASESHLQTYFRLYNLLADLQYDQFTIFDNFGNILLETDRTRELTQLARYVATLASGISTRTIYYVDVLASTLRYRAIHENAICRYRKKFLGYDAAS